MLMAAGLGTRLKPFTDRLPKPLFPVLDVPVSQFAVEALACEGVTKIVANVHHLAHECEAGLRALDLGGARLEISDESAQLLGSAGGLKRALPKLAPGNGTEAFFLFNGDILCSVDLHALAVRHARLRAQWGVSLTLALLRSKPGSEKYREIRVDPSTSLISGFGELQSGTTYFSGVAVLEPEALAHVPDGPAEFVPTILEPAIRAGRAGAYLSQAAWHDIGSARLWRDTHVALLRGLETGEIPRAWRRRLEAANERLGPQVWISRGSPRPRSPAEWAAPCYWSAAGAPGAEAPAGLGPGAVLYGSLPSGVEARTGIGWGGLWSPISGA